jgi:transposase
MFLSFNTSIWLYPGIVDFRKQIDGLVLLIADHMEKNPTSGQLFLFRNRDSNKLKILCWDRNGFWLFYKRLERGKFRFPVLDVEAVELTRDQLNWLLSGLDCLSHPLLPEVKASNFY